MTRGDSFHKIVRLPTALLIADQLREAIVSGDLAQGVQVGEAQLAARFGVSRGPLREAMQRLVQEGLLRSVPHRGLFVIELSQADIADIYAARLAVESGALAAIMAQADPGAVARRLDKVVRRMTAAAARGDLAGLGRADLAFHEQLVEASGSPRLQRMAKTLMIETRMCLGTLTDKYRSPAELANEHARLVEAIGAGDAARAHALLEDHMQDAVVRLSAESPVVG